MQFDGSLRTIDGWIGWRESIEKGEYIRSKKDIESLHEEKVGIETSNWYSCLEGGKIEEIKIIEKVVKGR